MAEGREHRRLVRALVGHLQDCHVTVAAAAIRGWPSPPAIGLRRPDALGYCAPLGIVVAGEAKRGPELWSCRLQLAEIAEALPRLGPSGTDAVLMLATAPGWEDDARAVAESLPRYRTVITVWSPPTTREVTATAARIGSLQGNLAGTYGKFGTTAGTWAGGEPTPVIQSLGRMKEGATNYMDQVTM